HLLHGQIDLEDVPAGLVAGAGAGLALAGAERLAGLARALAHARRALLAVAELRDVDLRQGDGHEGLAPLADHLAAADVLREVALHLAADELAEALVVAFDLLSHGWPPEAPVLAAARRAARFCEPRLNGPTTSSCAPWRRCWPQRSARRWR